MAVVAIDPKRLEKLGPAERTINTLTTYIISALMIISVASCESNEKKVARCNARCHNAVVGGHQPGYLLQLCVPLCNRDKDPDRAFPGFPE
jgi:hypothetical protein